MAGQLYEALRIPVTEAQALQRRCYFGGHSLGGSLALLLAVLFRLRLPLSSSLLQCCTFGSPPVLSHGTGRGGNEVLQVCLPFSLLITWHRPLFCMSTNSQYSHEGNAPSYSKSRYVEKGCLQMLGLPEGSMRSFVLENDPVPRALLSVDPTFTALKNSRPGAALLQLRHWLLGPGVPLTPDRFLADNVGEVNLLRWAPDTGHRVRFLVFQTPTCAACSMSGHSCMQQASAMHMQRVSGIWTSQMTLPTTITTCSACSCMHHSHKAVATSEMLQTYGY